MQIGSGLIKAVAISGFVVLGMWGAHARSQNPTKLKPPTNLSATPDKKNKPLKITTTAMPVGQVGVPYSFQFTATGGEPPYHWSIVEGSLPPGLQLTDGQISGTPLVAGTFGPIKIQP